MEYNEYFTREDRQEIRLMVKVATLFYLEELTQTEISKELQLSSAKVSRLLKKAREKNITHVIINNPLPFVIEEERYLETTFGLREVLVVSGSSDEEATIQRIGQVAAEHFLHFVKENMIIGIGQGTAMRAFVDGLKAIAPEPCPSITVIPLVGGFTKASPETHTNFLAREMANALGGTHIEMYAPTLADSISNRNAFVSDSSVEFVLKKARAADIIITGIGDISETSRLIPLCSFTKSDMERLSKGGAVGEVGSNFFNSEGKPCCDEYNQRVVGLSLNEIISAPLVIGVAGGHRKINAVQALLKNKVLDVLITDDVVASAIHNKEQNKTV